MTAITHAPEHPAAPTERRRVLVPSILSGLVIGLVGAVLAAVIVHAVAGGDRRNDDTIVAAYVGWLLFFLLGMGAANHL